jgi:hypothetical protein
MRRMTEGLPVLGLFCIRLRVAVCAWHASSRRSRSLARILHARQMLNQISDGVTELEPNNPEYAESDKADWERNPGSRVALISPISREARLTKGGMPSIRLGSNFGESIRLSSYLANQLSRSQN